MGHQELINSRLAPKLPRGLIPMLAELACELESSTRLWLPPLSRFCPTVDQLKSFLQYAMFASNGPLAKFRTASSSYTSILEALQSLRTSSNLPAPDQNDFARRTIAYNHTLGHHGRGTSPPTELWSYFRDTDPFSTTGQQQSLYEMICSTSTSQCSNSSEGKNHGLYEGMGPSCMYRPPHAWWTEAERRA